MKKLLLPLFILLAACSCVSSTQTPYTNSKGDPDAEYAQNLMKSTVKFVEKITVVPVNPDGSVGSEITGYSSGSGVVIDEDPKLGVSRIMTAWHVCNHRQVGDSIDTMFATLKITGDSPYITTIDGQDIDFEVLVMDKAHDLCVVEVNHHFPGHATLASEMPPRGAFVSVVGAPEGNWGNYLVSMSDGRYLGLTEIDVSLGEGKATHFTNYGYYGFAGVGGYSGSPIYYRGKLIGIMTAGSGNYEHACYGPTLDALKDILSKAKSI